MTHQPELAGLAEASRWPLVALNKTQPQAIPPHTWTAISWDKVLTDNVGGWTRAHPTRYAPSLGSATRSVAGFYDSRFAALRVPDVDPGMVALGILVDGAPLKSAATWRTFAGQDPQDRKDGVAPRIEELAAPLLFHLGEGQYCEMGVWHSFPGALQIAPVGTGISWTVQHLHEG